MKNILIKTIKVYQDIQKSFRLYRVPPFIYFDCKFYPTCSDYTIKQIQESGPVKGLVKGVLRILRCNPLIRF